MLKRIDLKLVLRLLLTLVDEIIFIIVAVWILSILGITAPWWFIATVALVFLAISFLTYRGLKRNPTMGFENMVGQTGRTISIVNKKGTARFGRELWQVVSELTLGVDSEVKVIEQQGLILTVVKNS